MLLGLAELVVLVDNHDGQDDGGGQAERGPGHGQPWQQGGPRQPPRMPGTVVDRGYLAGLRHVGHDRVAQGRRRLLRHRHGEPGRGFPESAHLTGAAVAPVQVALEAGHLGGGVQGIQCVDAGEGVLVVAQQRHD